MYISELKMHGFKSFASKESLKLGEGITTVVGPNGCGKTNIVDAIRWVLGEQKSSVLRSGKMEDVIFNGSAGLKPLSVCEVSLIVHNNKGKLPIEYNDIEIGRRVYRSGESEYFLNKTPCRLKDINELFVDTGMGADAYSVIELKMIEQILSEAGDDRRRMFEEAAGINKYRHQRKSTLRKFEATHLDLERISDIIAEVEQKVHGLALQLKRFERHAKLTDKLKNADLALAFLQVNQLAQQSTPLQSKITELQYLRESKATEGSIHENELNQLQEVYQSQSKELTGQQEALNSLNDKRESLQNDLLVWTEQNRSSEQSINRLDLEKRNNESKKEQLKSHSTELEKDIDTLEPIINNQLELYQTEKENYDSKNHIYETASKVLDALQDERWSIQRKISNDESLLKRTEAVIQEKENRFEKLKDQTVGLSQAKKELLQSTNSIENEWTKAVSALTEKKESLIKFENQIFSLREDADDLSKSRHSISAQIESLKGQHGFYHELIESKEGFPEGTRYILENPKTFDGVLGTVADIFEVDPSYRNALEAGLGDLSHCLVAIDRNAAVNTLEKARSLQAGDLTIIPLKEASNLKITLKKCPEGENIIGRASDLVSTNKSLKPLAEYLLGNLLIIEDLQDAMDNSQFDGWSLVDKNGAYLGDDLVLKNRQASEHGHIMGRKKKIETINQELSDLEKELSIVETALEQNQNSMNEAKEAIQGGLQSVEQANQHLSQCETNKLRNQFQLTQQMETLETLSQEIKDLEQEIKDGQKAIEALKPAMVKAEKLMSGFKVKIEKANTHMLESRKERDDFSQKVQDIRIALLELESQRENLVFKLKTGKETIEELSLRQNDIQVEMESLNEKRITLDENYTSGEKELTTLTGEIQKQKSILDLKQSAYKETYESIEAIQSKIQSEQHDREQLLEDLKNAELDVAESNQKLAIIRERIQDRYQMAIPKSLQVDETEDELSFDIDKFTRSLENIGPVNMAVKDEYEEEVERLNTLKVQCDDLSEAEENLRETIRKIDRIARKRFQETFDLIKTNFEKLFQMFFEGGHATLRLVGDPDPLDSSIAIEAQPPGKRNSSLRLLSSGEKALTAISLLFAIYQVKPSPYCILDEVDAPLDDVNIHKFTRVLKKFSDETQFIVVTHNKLTMENADMMYGVTQEKKGVSKLVSVKFE
ncbi:MAG: chromosome segregation protein SMC [Candidatus Marinimicrobia bacterium]|jgi:chromosome segregation protein|nr:chromosome segregation protein SMC [Candidatus Neomarinimicrobiota bacterium]MBT4734221.1 chromosome segregation protein SMC [Candidatus Neomarinimicrobiota bacterium]MBT6936150.1 chromosome segregation protein SMC [Candidatus Neomarinimicrobiota bacterium]